MYAAYNVFHLQAVPGAHGNALTSCYQQPTSRTMLKGQSLEATLLASNLKQDTQVEGVRVFGKCKLFLQLTAIMTF